MQGEDASLLSQATATSAPEISTAQFWIEESHPWAASTSNGWRAGRILRRRVFIIARRSRGVLPLPTVQVTDGEEARGRGNRLTAVDKDTDAAQPTGCQSEADSQAPAAYPCISKAPRLCTRRRMRSSCAKRADSGTLCIITTTRQKEWFGKYMKYKRHEETRFTLLLQRHFPLSKFAGYDLAQDKLIYLWDFQRRERTIEAEKEKKRQQAQRACARVERRTQFGFLLNWLALEANICSNMQKNKTYALMHKYAKPNMMHKFAFYFQKYALYAWICRRVNMPQYADLNFKYAEIFTKYAATWSTKSAGICTNKQIRNMQNK